MQVILAWATVLVVLVVPYPSTVWLLKRGSFSPDKWLALILTVGLGIGMLTWLMMVEGMLGIPFELWSILLPYLIAFIPGTWRWWREKPQTINIVSELELPTKPKHIMFVGRLVVTLVSAAILLNAIYWPFYKADAVAIYADQAHFMYIERGLIPLSITTDSTYQAYPMLVQLSYTYTYLASGWENPYLSKIIPTLLSLACLGAVFYLGKTLYDEKTGWLAVLLFVLTPLFGRWASSGYADLPMAFYYTLAVLFAWRTWTSSNPVDALISGAAVGLGAWTKNAMLPAVVFWLAFMLLGLVWKHIRIKTLLIAGIACAVVAAPWYLRNLIEAHLLMPATAWTDQAAPNLSNLLVFITHPENFGLTGWIIIVGIGLALVQIVRNPRKSDPELLMLIFTLPYFAFWWLLASYDRRFLLYFLPILAVLAAGYGLKLWERIPRNIQMSLSWLLTAMALGMTVYITSISIDYKTAILHDPFMNDAAKHKVITIQPSDP